jgi:hypothetical protein
MIGTALLAGNWVSGGPGEHEVEVAAAMLALSSRSVKV